jgi:hypothetical protein
MYVCMNGNVVVCLLCVGRFLLSGGEEKQEEGEGGEGEGTRKKS